MNKNIAIIGSQFGDEAKARVAHLFSRNCQFLCRVNGGSNSGHTIYVDGKKYVHHIVPAIDFKYSQAKGFLSAGMVIDLKALYDELILLEKDFPSVSRRIIIDPDAFIVTTEHIEEDKKKNAAIGSTNRGIGPAYTSKVSRQGIRIGDVLKQNSEYTVLTNKLKELGCTFTYALQLRKEFENSSIVFEGAQSVLLDIQHGSYPFVTSSDCTVSGIYSSGFNFIKVNTVYGIAKAYSTRVGNGPFPTEINGLESEELRQKGGEWGATTGRPRRVGWLDLPALRYAVAKGGITKMIITKLDILDGMKEIPVCVEYESGDPVCGQDFFTAVPKYVNLKGWDKAKSVSKEVQDFISFVETNVGVDIDFVSAGVNPEDLISLT